MKYVKESHKLRSNNKTIASSLRRRELFEKDVADIATFVQLTILMKYEIMITCGNTGSKAEYRGFSWRRGASLSLHRKGDQKVLSLQTTRK